jgi:outer membrane protein assembly factor BamD
MRTACLIFTVLLILSCAKMTEEKRARKAAEYYSEAMAEYRNGEYDDAAHKFREALKFMDYLTPQQIENARFLMGKSYYLDKDYVNAIVALEDYIFHYPKLPRTQEAYYMLIDSYIKVSPDPHRDQEYTWKAIDKARDFLTKFPQSPYAPKVQELIDRAYTKIAKHEYLIAKFYEDYGYPYSAALRYREILINFPQYISEEEVAFRYIKNLIEVDKQAKKAKEVLKDLLEEARNSLKEAKPEEREFIKRRIDFIKGEIKRWEDIEERSRKEALEALRRYREVYGETIYYRKLEKLLREKGWKS